MDYYITSKDNVKLFVQEFGKGKPVIILTGGPINPIYFKAVWEKLSQNYRCIVLHQRCIGKSILTNPDSISLSMNCYNNDIEALRIKLKLNKLTIIGHSWGGMLALEYASVHPDKLEKLVLLGSGGPTNQYGLYFSDNIHMRLHEEDLIEEEYLNSLNQPNLKAIFPGYFFDRKLGLSAKGVLNFDSIYGQPEVYTYVFENYFDIQAERVKNLKKKFTAEVYLIQGRQDPIGESTVYEIKDVLPQTRIHFIERCGHFPWMEGEPQITEFYEQLLKYLNSH